MNALVIFAEVANIPSSFAHLSILPSLVVSIFPYLPPVLALLLALRPTVHVPEL